jgi:hypothetical protein
MKRTHKIRVPIEKVIVKPTTPLRIGVASAFAGGIVVIVTLGVEL